MGSTLAAQRGQPVSRCRPARPDGNERARDWVTEFSRYDACWLHFFKSENRGELQRANWDDLNYPARISTLAAAGLPMIQRANPEAIVATQTLAQELDIGIFCNDVSELGSKLAQTPRMDALRNNVWRARPRFTFDNHVDRLVEFFREVISQRRQGRPIARTAA